MRTILFRTLFLMVAITTAGQSANYFTLYQEQVSGAQNYTWIDPVIDSSGELQGFVFSDSSNKKLIIQTQTVHQEIPLPDGPEMSVNRWIAGDSIRVYCLFPTDAGGIWYDKLGMALIHNDSVTWRDTLPPVYFDPGDYGTKTYRNIRLLTENEQPMSGILYESSMMFTWYPRFSLITGWSNAFAMLFDNDLQTIKWKDHLIDVSFGRFMSPDSLAYCGFSNDSVFSDGRADSIFSTYYYGATQGTIKYSPNDSEGVKWVGYSCKTVRLFGGDFRTDYPNDEVIDVGDPNAVGVTELGNGKVAVCYSFASGQRQIIWYNYEDRWDSLDFWYKGGGVIAGKNGTNVAIFLNARTGIPGDSAVFLHDISSFRYFETGSNPKLLNLVGRSNDTVIVYQFDQITDVKDADHDKLPAQFTLSQNYPNPFNPNTTIQFAISRRTNIHLLIYNALGQKVRELVNETLPPGNYSRVWDGKNEAGKPVASGMYFYQVSEDSFSQSKKMLLLK